MDRSKLSAEQVQAHLANLEGWELVDAKLYRRFQFASFVEAFGFMTKVALVAEALDHHPEWCNVYKTVTVHLTTHAADGLTELDFRLAQQMNDLAKL